MKKPIRIQQPCHEDWHKMSATERGRFCASCNKEVHDFTNSTTEEILHTLKSSIGVVCGRLQRNQVTASEHDQNVTSFHKPFRYLVRNLFTFLGTIALLWNKSNAQELGQTVIMGDTVYTDEEKEIVNQVLEIKGAVLDSADDKPLPFASVIVKSGDRIITGQSTDSDGKFILKVASGQTMHKKVTIEVTYVGYEKIILNDIRLTKDHTALTIRMNGVTHLLGEVQVVPDGNQVRELTCAQSFTVMGLMAYKSTHSTPDNSDSTSKKMGTDSVFFKLYPNPATGYFKIHLTTRNDYKVEVLDAAGRKITSSDFSGKTTMINSQHFEPGTYLVTVTSRDGHYRKTERVIIE